MTNLESLLVVGSELTITTETASGIVTTGLTVISDETYPEPTPLANKPRTLVTRKVTMRYGKCSSYSLLKVANGDESKWVYAYTAPKTTHLWPNFHVTEGRQLKRTIIPSSKTASQPGSKTASQPVEVIAEPTPKAKAKPTPKAKPKATEVPKTNLKGGKHKPKVKPDVVEVQETHLEIDEPKGKSWSLCNTEAESSYVTDIRVITAENKKEAMKLAKESNFNYLVEGLQMWNEPIGQIEESDEPANYYRIVKG